VDLFTLNHDESSPVEHSDHDFPLFSSFPIYIQIRSSGGNHQRNPGGKNFHQGIEKQRPGMESMMGMDQLRGPIAKAF